MEEVERLEHTIESAEQSSRIILRLLQSIEELVETQHTTIQDAYSQVRRLRRQEDDEY